MKLGQSHSRFVKITLTDLRRRLQRRSMLPFLFADLLFPHLATWCDVLSTLSALCSHKCLFACPPAFLDLSPLCSNLVGERWPTGSYVHLKANVELSSWGSSRSRQWWVGTRCWPRSCEARARPGFPPLDPRKNQPESSVWRRTKNYIIITLFSSSYRSSEPRGEDTLTEGIAPNQRNHQRAIVEHPM